MRHLGFARLHRQSRRQSRTNRRRRACICASISPRKAFRSGAPRSSVFCAACAVFACASARLPKGCGNDGVGFRVRFPVGFLGFGILQGRNRQHLRRRGNAGQFIYGFSQRFAERLAQYRSAVRACWENRADCNAAAIRRLKTLFRSGHLRDLGAAFAISPRCKRFGRILC